MLSQDELIVLSTPKFLEFDWQGTQLGIRVEGELNFTYVDLKGVKGDKGDKGIQGDKGDIGTTGQQGLKGDKGDKGDIGDIGTTGPQGVKGDKGIQGDKGNTGATGPQGLKGDTGLQGIPGSAAEIQALFTPRIRTVQSTTEAGYSSRKGYYYRLGNFIFFALEIVTNSPLLSSTNQVAITLPITAVIGYYIPVDIFQFSGFGLVEGEWITGTIQGSLIRFWVQNSGMSSSALQASSMASNCTIRISGSYPVDF